MDIVENVARAICREMEPDKTPSDDVWIGLNHVETARAIKRWQQWTPQARIALAAFGAIVNGADREGEQAIEALNNILNKETVDETK